MTKWQEQEVRRIRKYIEDRDLYNSPKYEFKEYKVTETDYGTVILYSVTGLVGDEGTMAAVLARTTRHIFIGPKGGLRCFARGKNGKSKILTGWSDVMIFGYDH
ncbi:MAG: hypothetical protein LBN43_04240 [Oscillospiraceae bacterium]|nr:hypothetical protein [Oscillospiraceae bacterium]